MFHFLVSYLLKQRYNLIRLSVSSCTDHFFIAYAMSFILATKTVGRVFLLEMLRASERLKLLVAIMWNGGRSDYSGFSYMHCGVILFGMKIGRRKILAGESAHITQSALLRT